MGLIDSILGAESGGDPTARNPRSSASGLGQFIDQTWLDMLSRHRPDLKGSRDELLSLKSDPVISRQMTEAYATDNGQILSNAGLPVTPGTTYLAHFAGPQGAVSVLKADPAAPVSSVLDPAAIKANPFLQGMTVADLRGWADRKMGGQKTSPASPASSSMPIPAQSAPPMFAPPAQQPQGQPQQAQQASYLDQFPADQFLPPPPIFAPPQQPITLAALRTRPSGGFFHGNRR